MSSELFLAVAGNAAGEATYVEDVFSTYLYEGTSATQTITNGIDLDGEGGLVWCKARNYGDRHCLFDTERGATKRLSSNLTNAEFADVNSLTSFNSNGFTLGSSALPNRSTYDHVSWTFAKQEKFFDVVTYTGDGNTGRTVDHNLGSVPGMIVTKRTDSTSNWFVWHRSFSSNDNYLMLNNIQAETTNATFFGGAPTDTTFTVGSNANINGSGGEYVAYLFAHNDGDGEFGEDADQDIIKCGTISGQQTVDIGFEPQWILLKRTDSAGDWRLVDNMRGLTAVNSNDAWLEPNTSDTEASGDFVAPTSTGFFNDLNGTYIYIAIRRGPMKTPESGTEVFAPEYGLNASAGGQAWSAGFPVDMYIRKNPAGGTNYIASRMTGNGPYMATNSANAEASLAYSEKLDNMDGVFTTNAYDYTTWISWMFRRAPGFFDVVAYTGDTGTGAGNRVYAHNLGVTPELMITKARNEIRDWYVNVSGSQGKLNTNDVFGSDSTLDNASTTATHFYAQEDTSTRNYIVYLFASLPGISKVGSYTGNGTATGDSQVIDCGFSAGARFVLIKRTDLDKDWWVMDRERGIVAGDDKLLRLNLTSGELSGDIINPNSSGFEVEWRYGPTDGANINASGASYIFLAIA